MTAWSILVLSLALTTTPQDRVILEFTDQHCPACQRLQPTVDRLVDDGWVVRQVHFQSERELFERWRVQRTPTIIVLQEGREVDRIVGAANYENLISRLTGKEPANHSTIQPAMDRPNAVVRGQSPLTAGMMVPLTAIASHELTPHSRSQPNAGAPRRDAVPRMDPRQSIDRQSFDRQPLDRQPHREQPIDRSNKQSVQAQPIEATVRILVDDGSSESVGTGTIIDQHGQEFLVLTCGHLFRDGRGRASTSVDLFVGGEMRRLPARVIDYRADEVDIGLISFQFDGPIAVAKVRPGREPLQEHEKVFSLGCDGGANPSLRESHITKLNRYLGPSNIEAAGAPVQGRSGGGLFDGQGRLIGVCYAADQELDEGLYAGPEVILAQLQRIGLQGLVQR